MVKGKPHVHGKKVHKSEGHGAITKFFDARRISPGAVTEQPPGGAVLQFNRTPTIQQAAVPQDPGSSWYPKHGVDGEASVLSQDGDSICVVWHDSPGTSQPTLPPGSCPNNTHAGMPVQNFNALKQRLISAAQKPRDHPHKAGHLLLAAPHSGRATTQADALLDGLFSRAQPAGGDTPGRHDMSVVPETSHMSACHSDLTGAQGCHKTPATHLRGILKRAQAAPAKGGTPGSNVKFELAGSTAKLAHSRSAKQQGKAHKARRQSGQKRKALLELLEQVETIVQNGASQEEEEQVGILGSGQAQGNKENSQLHSNSQNSPAAGPKPGNDINPQKTPSPGVPPAHPSAAGRRPCSSSQPLPCPQHQERGGSQPTMAAGCHRVMQAPPPPRQESAAGTLLQAATRSVKPSTAQQQQQQQQRPSHAASSTQRSASGSETLPGARSQERAQPDRPFPSITTGAIPPRRHPSGQAAPLIHPTTANQSAVPAHPLAHAAPRAETPTAGMGESAQCALQHVTQQSQQPGGGQGGANAQGQLDARGSLGAASGAAGCVADDEDALLAELELQLMLQIEEQQAAARSLRGAINPKPPPQGGLPALDPSTQSPSAREAQPTDRSYDPVAEPPSMAPAPASHSTAEKRVFPSPPGDPGPSRPAAPAAAGENGGAHACDQQVLPGAVQPPLPQAGVHASGAHAGIALPQQSQQALQQASGQQQHQEEEQQQAQQAREGQVPRGRTVRGDHPPQQQQQQQQQGGCSGVHAESWADEEMPDAELLAQAEADALSERAERSLGGDPPGPSHAPYPQPPGQPRYPGDREEVHYVITEVIDSEHDQVLRLHSKYRGREVFAHLRSPWSDLPYRVGDAVNLLATLDCFDGQYHCLLDMERGMLVLHPDVLLSGTRITGSNSCPRQAILDEKIAVDGGSKVAVKGTLQHSLIQAALQENLRSPPQLHRKAQEIVAASVDALLEVDMDEAEALAALKEATPGILRWMHRFLKPVPSQEGLVSGGFDPVTNKEIRQCISVPEVVDIEESVWSTRFGVKGMIDVSVKMSLEDAGAARLRRQGAGQGVGWAQSAAHAVSARGQASTLESVVAPVEIKTGKPHDSHRAQVLLYLLLMEERYGHPLDWGLLWYTTQPDPQLVKRKPYELASLMAVRNRLAAYIAHGEMAPLTDLKKQCHWCFQQQNCALYHKAIEGGTGDSFKHVSTDRGSGDPGNVQIIFDKHAGHLNPAECEFLKKWVRLVDLEEGDIFGRRAEIWSLTGEEREKLGRCLAGLVLDSVDQAGGLYTFRRANGGAFPGSALAEGEMAVLSIEGRHVTVARAVVHTVTPLAVTVSLQKPLRPGLLRPSDMESGIPTTQPPVPALPHSLPPPGQQQAPAAGQHGGREKPGGCGAFDDHVRWRLDRDEISSTFVKLRGNLFSLFRADDDRATRLRQLIVGQAAPQLEAPLDGGGPSTPATMNTEQHLAVRRVLASKDYTLVLGMPGSGKTTTIVSMVRALVAQGKSVLVTSYTNSAVDNILLKLSGEAVPFVRLGREHTVHPAVRPFLPGGEKQPHSSVAALRQLGETVPVVGATCFGMAHPMLRGRMFDVCILDEAGQITVPASLGPLLRSKSFVLVGDHNQLPPLVTNRQAEQEGLGVSLFNMLSEAHPQAVVRLPVQYRMASNIMDLANHLFYGGQLRCGSPAVADAVLMLSSGAHAELATQPQWVQQALTPDRRVVFLDTSQAGAQERLVGDALSNEGEAGLVLRLLRAATAAGVAQDRLGVISPYRAQVTLLERLARGVGLQGVECLTVDKCQGRDKDCVVVSFVRSNPQQEAGKLLRDWRRINVALTRAKSKLVLVGDVQTLGALPLFQQLVALVQERGWMVALPAGCCPAPGGQQGVDA